MRLLAGLLWLPMASSLSMATAAPQNFRKPTKIVRPPRLPVWPAWQGVPLLFISQLPGPFRGWADRLEDAFGGRVCPIQFDEREADPFILLVHHRHSFRPGDFLRPLFEKLILPEGFPAHPHRGFETVTYVLPGRAGLTHRDSEGTKMRYGNGAVQWMTAGRGMLHEEMWDVDAGVDHELYQLWVNLPPTAKFASPRVQLLEPHQSDGGDGGGSGPPSAQIFREGSTPVRRASLVMETLQGGKVTVRYLARADGSGAEGGAETYSPMEIVHVELTGKDAEHTLTIPDGWTCLVYCRRGAVRFGGAPAADAAAASPVAASDSEQATTEVAVMHEMAFFPRRGGDSLFLSNAADGGRLSDVLVLTGAPIGAPVAASGTMVMNSQAEVSQAMADYQRGDFGIPWEHTISDSEWAAQCDAFVAKRGF